MDAASIATWQGYNQGLSNVVSHIFLLLLQDLIALYGKIKGRLIKLWDISMVDFRLILFLHWKPHFPVRNYQNSLALGAHFPSQPENWSE